MHLETLAELDYGTVTIGRHEQYLAYDVTVYTCAKTRDTKSLPLGECCHIARLRVYFCLTALI